jgi:hypothetical protein
VHRINPNRATNSQIMARPEMSPGGTIARMNERLRRAMLRRGLDIGSLAESAEIKSVERWIVRHEALVVRMEV